MKLQPVPVSKGTDKPKRRRRIPRPVGPTPIDKILLLKKLFSKFGVANINQMAKLTGLSQPTLNTLKTHKLSEARIANFIKNIWDKGGDSRLSNSIRPIVEYYPIVHTESKHGANREILPTGKKDGRESKIADLLKEKMGLYIFYNSEGNAIYTGKTTKRYLWEEMKDVFNRKRATQKRIRVGHPTTGNSFVPAYEKPRDPRNTNVYLHQIAFYFSAYEVDINLRQNLEAFIIRAFANNLSNVQIARFKFPKK